jgi:hypothetical protein
MKYIKAILYTVLMSILFLTGIIVVEGIVSAQQIDEIVQEALEADDYQIMLSGQYQSSEPMIVETASLDDLTVTIRGYETMSVLNDVEVYYLEFIIYATTGEIDPFADVTLELTNGEYAIKFLKLLNRELYLMVSESNDTRLLVSEIFTASDTTLDKLIITYEVLGEEKVLTIPLGISNSDLTFLSSVNAYKTLNNNTYPLEDTDTILLQVPIMLNTVNAVIITVIVEVIVIVALTVYIYVIKPRRRLGKINPSKHLQKDIEKITDIPKE